MEYPFIEDRKQRLAAINQILKERGLKPLTKLGDSKVKGETEIIRILTIYDHAKRFYIEVEFEVRFSGGEIGSYTLSWNAHSLESDGNVYVIMVNNYYLLTKQHRLATGKWKRQLPRGFHVPLPKRSAKKLQLRDIEIQGLPTMVLLRELGDEVIKNANVIEVAHLGNIYQNDGVDTACPSFWLVRLEVDEGVLQERITTMTDEGVKIVLLDKIHLEHEIGQPDGISDSLSITAIHLAEQYDKS